MRPGPGVTQATTTSKLFQCALVILFQPVTAGQNIYHCCTSIHTFVCLCYNWFDRLKSFNPDHCSCDEVVQFWQSHPWARCCVTSTPSTSWRRSGPTLMVRARRRTPTPPADHRYFRHSDESVPAMTVNSSLVLCSPVSSAQSCH